MITKQDYQTRRQEVASRLPPSSIAVIPAASDVIRNGDSHYRFRQDSDLQVNAFCLIVLKIRLKSNGQEYD